MFGFYVNTSAPRLQLPTKKFPLEFSVIETKTNLNVAMGIGVGVVLALCVSLLLWLIKSNSRKAKKIFLSFMRTNSGLMEGLSL